MRFQGSGYFEEELESCLCQNQRKEQQEEEDASNGFKQRTSPHVGTDSKLQ